LATFQEGTSLDQKDTVCFSRSAANYRVSCSFLGAANVPSFEGLCGWVVGRNKNQQTTKSGITAIKVMLGVESY
jgi:hypothetical protein